MITTRRDFLRLGGLAALAAFIPVSLVAKTPEIPVPPKVRTLKAVYTPEMAQDLRAYHGLDAEEELMHILSQEIQREIDKEVLGTITKGEMITDPKTFMRYRTFTFTEDGKNSYKNMWGLKL